jgi:hypothetical protein
MRVTEIKEKQREIQHKMEEGKVGSIEKYQV